MKNISDNGAEKNQVRVKPYTQKELAVMYAITTKTFRKWLKPYEKEIGKKTGHFFMVKQVEKIFQLFGFPVRLNHFINEVLPERENGIERYIDAAWDFAHTMLWNGKHFSAEEIALCKKTLCEFFTLTTQGNKPCPEKRLSIFCQRVLLTRSYIDYKPAERFMPNPALWFDKSYQHGFAGTAKWMKQIAEERKRNPFHREELMVLAELYHEYMLHRSLVVTVKAAAYLSRMGRTYLLRIFCHCISELNARPDYMLAA